jgi:hypothetical protein
MVVRRSNLFCYQYANLPLIAYNLGDNKIIIQNMNQTSDNKCYILEMLED